MSETLRNEILFYLLKDGKMPLRKIAKLTGKNHATIAYHYNKLIEDGILGDFYLYVNPNLFGFYHFFAAYNNDIARPYPNFVASSFTCVEGFTVLEVMGKSKEEVVDRISSLGDPIMIFDVNNVIHNLSDSVSKMIKLLAENPKVEFSQVSSKVGLPVRWVYKKYNHLEKIGMIKIIPKVNLSKANVLLFSVFSKEPIESLDNWLVLRMVGKKSSLYLGVARNMGEAYIIASSLRSIVKDVTFTLKIDYDVTRWLNNGANQSTT
ncbi:winged helix-turn-helix domain-containing protein [Saccharolobus shibatae]|uniref:Uncharacterized protein n=1 Tax=Saccharolobus shibatae TaxID=2286 RepID=A0A8F5GWH6_9CREN|nr:winged helix-turn-helix domain-containing protein [Saccharolobus shibatae]QXJ32040.1 hypothetical protein J5U21_01691 [Saccharolobus shibatae]